MNLLSETVDCLNDVQRTPSDIIFIGSEVSGHSCTWDEFTNLADIEYAFADTGYAWQSAQQEIASDLIIVFRDGGRLRRWEDDGSEGWEFVKPFVMPENLKPIRRLDRGCWETLEDLNKGEVE